MVAIAVRPEDVPAALLNPTPTADKRTRRYNAALKARGKREKQTERVIPGLDLAALRAKYSGDPQNTRQHLDGTFKVPLGISRWQWETLRNQATEKFLAVLEKRGYVVERVRAFPGKYPYTDVLTGQDDPQYREMILRATCGLPKAERVVVELDPEDVEPIVQKR